MKIFILYSNYLNDTHDKVTVGGVQTYITNLCNILKKMDWEIHIIQFGNKDAQIKFKGIDVTIVHSKHSNPQKLYRVVKEKAESSDLVLFATDWIIVNGEYNSIAIQHGVAWDKPMLEKKGLGLFFEYYKRAWKDWSLIKKLSLVDQVMCVDYNFINWYRSQIPCSKLQMKAIPNFTEIADFNLISKQKNAKTINILFARRFFNYRGTRVFGNAITRILEKYNNVKVTLAGDGPDEMWLKNKLKNYTNVSFIMYESNESLDVHADKHIAVIPTTGSEGTSLSLLEAMSSQCAVICTNVGGMTNIVLDNYNGLMINPLEEELYLAISMLIENEKLRYRLAEKAYETVKTSFSYEIWENKWKDIFCNYEK